MDNHPAPTCVKCGHNNVDADGDRCRERVSGSTHACWCKCVFPAAPTDEVVADDLISRADVVKECERFLDALKHRSDERADGAFVALTRLTRNLHSLAAPPAHQQADDGQHKYRESGIVFSCRECGGDFDDPRHYTADDERVAEIAKGIVDASRCGGINHDGVAPVVYAVLVDRIASALAAARGPVAEQWRDIASAPKDGSKVLMSWADGHVQLEPSKPDDGNSFWFEEAPTHWMPLPSGPQAEREDES